MSRLHKIVGVLLLAFGWLPVAAWAQAPQITVPWQCGFEDAAENSRWVLNANTPNATDQWVIGQATHSEGKQSLYISTSEEAGTQYGNHPNVVMAYRPFRVPVGTPGKMASYNISFDWKNSGTSQSVLYVWVGTKKQFDQSTYLMGDDEHGLLDVVSETSALVPSPAKDAMMSLSNGNTTVKSLYGSKKWQNYYISGDASMQDVSVKVNYQASQQDLILAFIWVNGNTQEANNALGICIDNIQIASSKVPRPNTLMAEMSCEDSSLVVSWKSILSYHAVEYKNVKDSVWKKRTGIVATNDAVQTVRLAGLQEGSYDIRVKGCNDSQIDTSAYAVLNSVVLWCPDNHCINYINLEAPNVVCTAGLVGSKGMEAPPEVDTVGIVDYGEEAMESQHTVNWIEDRYDPCTLHSTDAYGNPIPGLRTIPEGTMASVRLGNWDDGYGYASITYTYEVDSFSQGILLMRYAILLEKPGHEGEPGFRLQVLDQNGHQVDPDCGVAEFYYSNASDNDWNIAPQQTIDGELLDEIRWKDWTAVGLNLAKYHGRTLTIKVEAGDCGASGHCGYAYFTLDCMSATLSTENCGEASEVSINAPDGFSYVWTNSKGEVIGTERVLKAMPGHEVYTCTACIIDGEGCCFEMQTEMDPRYPVPSYTSHWQPANCRNYVRMQNTSHVALKDPSGWKHTQESCEQVLWGFVNHNGFYSTTSEDNPLLECDPYGDTIYVTLRAVMGGGDCDSVMEDTIYVPSIYSENVYVNAQICDGETYIFNHQGYTQTGQYFEPTKNMAGCDSLTILNLTVNQPSPPSSVYDTICSADAPYIFNGFTYYESINRTHGLKNINGCDSLVTLHLDVQPLLMVDVDSLPTLCSDEQQLVVSLHVTQGTYDSLVIHFDQKMLAQHVLRDTVIKDPASTQVIFPNLQQVVPDYYTIQLFFYQHHSCKQQVFTLPFELRYRSSVVEQKWNDVLALLSPAYNGGYTFTAYQWYCDGQPIAGATGSYLYQQLRTDADYYLEMRRSDGVVLRTCDIRPVVHEQVRPFPTIAQKGQQIQGRLASPSSVHIVTMTGNVYSNYSCAQGDAYITAPIYEGSYIVQIVPVEGDPTTQYLLVE